MCCFDVTWLLGKGTLDPPSIKTDCPKLENVTLGVVNINKNIVKACEFWKNP